MFNADFFPTPAPVIDLMLQGIATEGKVILEPHVGSGRLVEALKQSGAREVIGCEKDPDLRKIARTHCKLIADDFLTVTSEQISHVQAIVMNPPFSNAAEHITHAWNIAPEGCPIVALCNTQTLKNAYTQTRKELIALIDAYGVQTDLGQVFKDAERTTEVEVSLIRLQKASSGYQAEFSGFFMEEDEPEEQATGLMSYNAVRDLVNRYVESLKIYDQQLETAVRLNELQADYFDTASAYNDTKGEISITISQGQRELTRNEFKKRMQRSGWMWIFKTMSLEKYATKGLREDINKFVEQQQDVPFTMRNIYKMLEIVIGTSGQRMEKALLEVFDKVTRHSHDNHYHVEGWKTNSHYLLTRKFIVPGYYKEEMEDMVKALCYISGENYDNHISLYQRTRYDYALVNEKEEVLLQYPNEPGYSHCKRLYHEYEVKNVKAEPGCKLISLKWEYGKWFDWGFFRVKHFKKGTYHFEFKSEQLWGTFNQRVAKIKGYPLPEKKEQTKYQERQNGRKPAQPAYKPTAQKPTILATFKV